MAEIKQKLKVPNVPNYIIIDTGVVSKKQDGFTESQSVAVGDLPNETLEEIVKEWRQELFRVATRQRTQNDRHEQAKNNK